MKKAIRLSVFLIVGVILFWYSHHVLRYRFTNRLAMYRELPANTVDVAIFGSSHSYRNMDPSVLWERYGISAYTLGTPSGWFVHSYYQMKESLRIQKPKVIILEAYKVYVKAQYPSNELTIKALTGFRAPLNRAGLVYSGIKKPEDRLDILADFPLWHSNYRNDLKKWYFNPFDKGLNSRGRTLGYAPMTKPAPYDIGYDQEMTDKEQLGEVPVYWLEKMRKLAEDNGAEFMLLLTPLEVMDRQPFFNELEEYASENGIPFLNMNRYLDEVGVNPEIDLASGGHLTIEGSAKWSAFLADYLHENYKLEDHRGQDEYKSWDDNLRFMNQKRDEFRKRYIEADDSGHEKQSEEDEDTILFD